MNNRFGLGYDTGSIGLSSQKLINKQEQALAFSYETLGNLLSSAENFAGFVNEKYSQYNISNANTYDELKSEFAWELHCFQLALRKYNQKYGPYKFPYNCSKEKIINDCKRYINKTKNEKDKILFYSMINIINGDKVDIDFDKLFEELDKNFANNKINPSKLVKLIGPLNYLLDQIGKDAEEGNISFNDDDNKKKKIKEKLKREAENDELTSVIYGKKGILCKNNNNTYKFTSLDKSLNLNIIIGEQIDIDLKKKYSAKTQYHEINEIKIYIDQKSYDGKYSCIIFDNKINQCPKSVIKIIDKENGYGYGVNEYNLSHFPILLVDGD